MNDMLLFSFLLACKNGTVGKKKVKRHKHNNPFPVLR
jgi:hypothetical protein